jgi:hypothetical protein
MSETNNKNKLPAGDINHIMREIERKTEKKLMTGYITGTLINPLEDASQPKKIDEPKKIKNTELLKQIIQEGSDEFQERTGRPMTYSEMRMMFG